MRGNASSRIVGRRRRGAQLGLGHRGPTILARPPAIVGVQLDDVGAGRDLAANRTHDVFAARFLGALRHFDARLESFRSVRAGRHDRARGDEHPRAGDDSLVDCLLQADIGITSAFRAEIAHRRESCHQRRMRCVYRAHGAQRDGFVQHLIVPTRLVIRMQEQMTVTLDQARNERRVGKSDFACSGVGHVAAGSDDAIAFDEHAPADVHPRFRRTRARGAAGSAFRPPARRLRQWSLPVAPAVSVCASACSEPCSFAFLPVCGEA